jgi:hypothetical protein
MANHKVYHPELTSAMLKSVLSYDSETGRFTWIAESRFRPGIIGNEAGSISTSGHRQIRIFGKTHAAHRLAWLYTFNVWPDAKLEIDHINLQPDDNRIENLRLVTRSQNQLNRRSYGKKSGLPRGTTRTRYGRFVAQASVDGKSMYFGTFSTAEEAHRAYLEGIGGKAEYHP